MPACVLDRPKQRASFQRLRQTEDPAERHALILEHERLALYIARKFADRGEPLEDVMQVARIGLIKAVDRYDLSRGVEFTTYATPLIVGEIKRYFRDKHCLLHIPRRTRELNHLLLGSVEALSQRLGRSPTIAELAEETGVPFDLVLEALEAGRAFHPASLDAEGFAEEGSEEATAPADRIGEHDAGIEVFENNAALEWAIRKLPGRLQKIVVLRFFRGLSQAEIGRALGISQMHVSRKLREALGHLRSLMEEST